MAISSYLLELVLVDEESRPAPEYRHEQDITHFYRLDAVGDVLRDLIEFPHHDLKVLEAGGMLSLRLAERAGRRGLVVATVRPGLSELLDGMIRALITSICCLSSSLGVVPLELSWGVWITLAPLDTR